MRDLLRAAPLIDGHNDLLWALRERRLRDGREWAMPDLTLERPEFQTDLVRLEAGGVRGQFWSVYVPSDLPGHEAVTATLEQIDALLDLIRRYPERMELAHSAADVERIAASGRVASMIGIEGGQSIGCSLGALRVLARFGVGYLTLTHNDDNPWADSATGTASHGGLTRFGEEVVRELNRSGMLVDLSHTSPDTMRQSLEVSEAPVIFSHSSSRALCDVTRNVPDDVIETVARRGGVVMVTFVPSFLTAEGAELNAAGWREAARLRAAHPDDPSGVRDAVEAWFATHPDPPASVRDVADHIDHVRTVAGIDHIGIGSDFDGAGTMPERLGDVAAYPTLFAELAERGYAEDELMKVAGGNVLRVIRDAERTAERLQTERAPSLVTIEQLDAP